MLAVYEQIVTSAAIIVAIVEVSQVTNFSVKVGKVLKSRISFDKGLWQAATLVILMIALAGFITIVLVQIKSVSYWTLYSPLILQVLLFIVLAITIFQTTSGRFEHGLVSNGMMFGAYLSLSTYQA